MKKLSVILASVLGVFAITLAPALPAYAVTCTDAASCVTSGVDNAGGSTAPKSSAGDIIKTIVNTLLFVIGAVSVVMIVIGGLKYVLSNGESSAVTSAKNTIFYAVIGLVVAALAYAIVNWVISMLPK
jgi:ABC-type Fe3+ transport system permease subunit